MISAIARAKVNLALCVTGRRGDGLHLLDSLVAFADFGDRVAVAPADELSLELAGPLTQGVPTGPDNLVMRAARLVSADRGARIRLEKHLPAAAGLGGGSADAAAVITLLSRLWGCAMPAPDALLALGADLPVCRAGATARVRGIGERLDPVPAMPRFDAVLVNPGVPLATARVFAARQKAFGPGLAPLPDRDDRAAWLHWLRAARNDLEGAAQRLVPAIGEAIAALAARHGCALARMSGSGASCFGLFETPDAAAAAATAIAAAHPDWFVQETVIG